MSGREAGGAAPVVPPTLDDPVVAAASPPVGGPLGQHAATGRSWWTPVRVLLALTCLVFGLGLLQKAPCRAEAWPSRSEHTVWLQLCYSDLPYLYRERGLAQGARPYLDDVGAPPFEYPVLTGAAYGLVAAATRASLAPAGEQDDPDRGAVRFYDLMSLLVLGCALVVVVATARTVPSRPYDAALVAASPVLALTATINADLLAVALASLAVLAWTRERPLLCGLLLGLGTATKLYPGLLLGAVLVVALRERKLKEWAGTLGVATVTWLVVDLPVWLAAPRAFEEFWRLNEEREADFGSTWYALQYLGHGVAPEHLDALAVRLLVLACALIALLGLLAPRPPRLAQIGFLVVAAFLLLNKVDSPQYALWLLPLAALARPRWRDLLVWQTGEVVHFVAVWLYLDGLFVPGSAILDPPGYAWAILARTAGILWLVGVVVRDVLRPEHDPVRSART